MADKVNAPTGRSEASEWAVEIARGDARALARMLSLIEGRAPLAREVLQQLYPRTGQAHTIGVTGAAGSGKSTLIALLAQELRRRGKKIGILTVDPTSPLTGGALLGDRVRMRDLFLDSGVFIRSLASRGYTGGISGALHESVQLLDAAGKEYIFVETIGIGQDQVDIAEVTETVILVITPESGDEVQAMKAGIVELADLFVINKADLAGAAVLREKVLSVLDVGEERLFLTSALRREGVDALVDGIVRYRAKLKADGGQRKRILANARARLRATLRDALILRMEAHLGEETLDQCAQKIADRRTDPYSAAEALLTRFLDGEKENEAKGALISSPVSETVSQCTKASILSSRTK